jgi:hypothetical protein
MLVAHVLHGGWVATITLGTNVTVCCETPTMSVMRAVVVVGRARRCHSVVGTSIPPTEQTVTEQPGSTHQRQSGGEVLDPGARERVYTKVRALLRKAESTGFPAEAEALTAKAQDLLTRYALDMAVMDGGGDGAGASNAPVVRPVPVAGAYATGRAMLLGAVASANRCSAVWDPQATTVMLVGFAVDLDGVELLWRSLMSQAEMAVAAAGPQFDHRGRSRTRSWRSAFWVSFGQRIGQRLAEQAAATVEQVAARRGDAEVILPVLASRQRDVDAAVRQHFPRLSSRRTRVSNGDGWSAGRVAADRARLHARRPVGS